MPKEKIHCSLNNIASKRLQKAISDEHRYYAVNEDGCWVWKTVSKQHGYGSITRNSKTHLAHRYFYKKYKGDIQAGLEVHHKCFNRACVNPEHLEATTVSENRKIRGERIILKPSFIQKNCCDACIAKLLK